MGCWRESCAITNTPLYYKDPCVMVLLSGKGVTSKWWMETYFFFHNSIDAVYKGTYNDYGWINEVKEPDGRPDYRTIFIHQDVWDEILADETESDSYDERHAEIFRKELPKIIQNYWYVRDMEPPKYLDELEAIGRFACNCRINLNSGLAYKGCQHEEQAKVRKLISMVQRHNERERKP